MNPIDLSLLNLLSPYTVVLYGDEYSFRTDNNIEYAVEFRFEPGFGGLPAYWFDLSNRSQKASPTSMLK